ncbi:MAG TPA: hypothetical protein VFJ16_31560 [Longimicrobium sp.]|nr:hypothetical protein [Longimicrobium sp.]
MPRTHALLLAAVLLSSVHAAAQQPAHPRKRTLAISRGMTPAQVREVLGEPVRVRREGDLAYMEYANGCAGCTADYVVVQDCRVVAARFENPSRQLLATPAPDRSAPPQGECLLAANDPGAPGHQAGVATAQAAADTGGRVPSPPRDTGPGGMAPEGRTVTQPAATLAEAPPQEGSAREWRRRLTLRRPVNRLVAVPAASLSSPTAFGVQMGEGFLGFAYQERTRFTSTDDGAAAIGIGLGDRRYVALEVAATSYSTVRGGGPLETGGISFKAHHAFNDQLGVAVGWENAISWGGSDAGNSPFGVVTRVFRLNQDPRAALSAVAASLGVGAGRFRSEADVVDDKATVNVFGSVGVQVIEPLSVVGDWNGQDLYAGVSFAPVRRVPLLVNAGFADITGNAGDGARFIISAGVGFRWLPPLF